MEIRWLASQLFVRNSKTRIPFRYGSACMTVSPQVILQVQIECDGQVVAGYAGDCLPPSWFDKNPDKDFRQQVDEMLASIAHAQETFQTALATAAPFFPVWLACYQQQLAHGRQQGWPDLLSSFGLSMVERAAIDAMCRARQLPFAQAIRSNVLGIDAGQVHEELSGLQPADWLPTEPQRRIYVRHTVGLGDPLTAADLASASNDPASNESASNESASNDPLPHTLEQYVQQLGQRYLKVKVSNQLEPDVARLQQIAAIVERVRGTDYHVTLDGNEQYRSIDEFVTLIERIRTNPALETFWKNVLLIEQPLSRSVALEANLETALGEISRPVIIDESDDQLTSFPAAIRCGYRGVSSKNCKGPLKSLLNSGLIWSHNRRESDRPPRFVMTGEDLCCVGMVPLQADLCLVATLGLQHVERNGHHYHRGLSYLPESEQQAILQAHPDLYADAGAFVAPHIVDGQFQVDSLIDSVGFGFAIEPRVDEMLPSGSWRFDSLL